MDLDAEFKTALAAHRAGDLAAAERGYRLVLATRDHLPSLNNLGVILEDDGRFAEAAGTFARAVQAAPGLLKPLLTLADHYRTTRQFAAAEPLYRRAHALEPENHNTVFHLGLTLLGMGRDEEGWACYDHRQARLSRLSDDFGIPEWRGEPLAGKRLFVYREQGFGDQIMMARFLPLLDAAEITYMGPPALERLFAALPVTYLEARSEDTIVPRQDYWILPGSLPGRLGLTARTAPNAPYLSGQARDAGGRIGVVWRGEPKNPNDIHRSLPPDRAAWLLALPGAISLDPADTGAADLQATADIISGLDLVITVDTATAHLAGALGRPVWVMLARHAIDWQWPREATSPWYPSARLFIQPEPRDWASLVDEVVREARAL